MRVKPHAHILDGSTPHHAAGFTLLELLVVLTIAGLLLAIVAPGLSDAVTSARLRVTARQIEAALRETRAAALRQAQPARLTVDAAGHGFATGSRNFVLPKGQSLSYAPFAGNLPNRPAAPAVEFLSDGSSTGGALIISNGRNQTRVAVDWLTGRISVQ